ncbi:MAG: transposase [Sulfuricurvum sp.]|uniref:transposase n=1 Tax=Sulfuricurvum sp. TaxID=2025608 RepID=UPI00263374F2|nr:transposase [Sulfuricurvum sp.]MDD5158626.1 transposase [Sulfuricurvum sp.]MDD5160308.1 transposase [Sulfuricurvum sp.]
MMKNGSEALASQKEMQEEAYAGLKFHLRSDNNIGGTEVSHTIGTDTSMSESHVVGGVKTPLPRKFTHLPHIDLKGYYQFVTFRTFESVDEFVRKWDFSPAMSNKEKQQKIDEYLDISIKGAYLKDDVLKYLFDFLISNDKRLYELVAFCIMNNHVHILFKPLENLSKVMQKIKGTSAKKINEILGKNGRFWADDYYDKAIRDEKHFSVVYEYIKNNPLKIDEINNSEAKASLPNGTNTLVSENSIGEIKYSFPRFYGVFE